MKRVEVTVIGNETQSASICEPVDTARVIDNALMRFGLTLLDLDIIFDHTYNEVRTLQGIVKEGTKIVNVIVH